MSADQLTNMAIKNIEELFGYRKMSIRKCLLLLVSLTIIILKETHLSPPYTVI